MGSASYEFGLIGLGVMGRNFILNVAERGFSALGYDLDPEKAAALREEGKRIGTVEGTSDLKVFVRVGVRRHHRGRGKFIFRGYGSSGGIFAGSRHTLFRGRSLRRR